MLQIVVDLIVTAFEACSAWFAILLDKTGMLPFYLAGIIVVFTSGFLLSRFGSLASGVSDSAANAYSKYRDRQDAKLAQKSGAWRSYYRTHKK